jgi:hypothetical protein
MSYEKAMKHSIKKSRKQANNHFGFDTGSGFFKLHPRHLYYCNNFFFG